MIWPFLSPTVASRMYVLPLTGLNFATKETVWSAAILADRLPDRDQLLAVVDAVGDADPGARRALP